MIANAKFISSDGPYLNALVEVDGVTLTVMDEFSDNRTQSGDFLDLEITAGLIAEQPWEAVFNGNPDRLIGLKNLSGWSYSLFGKVISVGPVIVDGAFLMVDLGHLTRDERCIGEHICIRIERLDATRV